MAVKFIHIILVVSVLFSSVGMTIGEHICHQDGEHFAFLLSRGNCCDEHSDCRSSCKEKDEEEPCCETFGHVAKLTEPQDFFDFEFKKLKTPQSAFMLPYKSWINHSVALQNKFLTYQLPSLIFDLPVLYQVFLC